MLKDKDFDELIQPIINIYNQIELELLVDVAKRFTTYSSISGSLEWYLNMLSEMNALNNDAVKIIAKYSKKSEKEIKVMLQKAKLGNFKKEEINLAYEQGFSHLRYEDLISSVALNRTFKDSYKQLDESFRLIQTNALESQKQAYMDVLNKSYIDVSSGTYSYDVAIRRAIKSMAQKGLNGATYKRKDGTLIHYSIEAAVRRDTLTATHQTANKAMYNAVKEMGANYVDVSSHLGARINDTNPIANHAGWQGKQYQLVGESKKYPNFIKSTGYGDILGFAGVNCRHRMFVFFPGISVPFAITYNEDENRVYYENTQKLRSMERMLRSYKKQMKCLDTINGTEEVKKLKQKIATKSKEIDSFCLEYGLVRDYTRELVAK